jgi:hypothetical protein
VLSAEYSASRCREPSKLLLYKGMSYELLCRVRFITPRSLSLELSISYIFLNSAMSSYKGGGLFFLDFLSCLFSLV